MTMGERIKQLRSANGFTQEMLAEKMNVSVHISYQISLQIITTTQSMSCLLYTSDAADE